jgi:hypothetical protein
MQGAGYRAHPPVPALDTSTRVRCRGGIYAALVRLGGLQPTGAGQAAPLQRPRVSIVGAASACPGEANCRTGCSQEPRSGERHLAWGVSPRVQGITNNPSPGGATEREDRVWCRYVHVVLPAHARR